MSKTIRWALACLILIAVIVWIEQDLGWLTVFAAWKNVPISYLIGLTVLTFVSYLLRSYRVYVYFGKAEAHPLLSYIRINFLHNALNNFLPMRLGEASFPLLMKRTFNYPILKSSAGLLLIRLMDLHWLLLLLSIMAAVQFGQVYLLFSVGIIVAPFILRWLGKHNTHFLPKFVLKKTQKITQKLSQYAPPSKQFILYIYFLTAIIWTIKLAALTVIILAFIDIPSMQGLFAVITADLSSVLPIHGLAGSGTFEAAILAALVPLGVEQDAVLLAAVNLHLYVLLVTLLSVPLALLIPNKTNQQIINVTAKRKNKQ